MSPVFLAHLAATWGLVGLIWTIQCVHYPLFAEVGAGAFPGYHRKHTQRIPWIVAPLMAVELITGLLLVPANGSAFFRWSLVFLAYNWISTACVQIPLHNRLGGRV